MCTHPSHEYDMRFISEMKFVLALTFVLDGINGDVPHRPAINLIYDSLLDFGINVSFLQYMQTFVVTHK